MKRGRLSNRTGIMIASSFGREGWAKECSESIPRQHVIVTTRGYEIDKLRWFMENTNWDRVVFIQDSMTLVDEAVFDIIGSTEGSICLNHNERHFGCFGGVYERRLLETMVLPKVRTKKDSILSETSFNEAYASLAQSISTLTCYGEVENPYRWIKIFTHGRWNVVYSTKFFTKWQGQWGQTPLDDLDIENFEG